MGSYLKKNFIADWTNGSYPLAYWNGFISIVIELAHSESLIRVGLQ
jgi:hypothetical protein